MKSDHFVGKYIKGPTSLRFISHAQEKEFEKFVSNVEPGMIVEVFYEVTHDDGTLPQLAKLHAMIRELASFSGETFEDMKLLVKDKAGLCIRREISGKQYFLVKSFAESSKEELSLAIQAALEIGDSINHPIR